jgi:hypothetical protein
MTRPKSRSSAPKTTNEVVPNLPAAKPARTPEQLQQIEEWKARRRDAGFPRFKIDEDGSLKFPDDDELALLAFNRATGIGDHNLASSLVAQVAETDIARGRGDMAAPAAAFNNALAVMTGIEPKDATEGMLAAQMATTHNLSMKFAERVERILSRTNESTNPDYERILTAHVERMTKLSRTYVAQMETLQRYRRGGQQKMVVEHVTVNEGGQAIVGIVSDPGGRGGPSGPRRTP